MDLKEVKKRIYGDILVSEDIGKALRKWREIFKITQSELARKMQVTPSVISDYEGGRQKYPGTRFIRRYVEALIGIDTDRGGRVLNLLWRGEYTLTSDFILDICDYEEPIQAEDVINATQSEVLANEDLLNLPIYGHTVLDSVATILTLSGNSFYNIYGSSSERALVFTKVSLGRSPMVAVRVYPLKPRVVILHGPSKVDELAVEIAQRDRIVLALSRMNSVGRLVESLKQFKDRRNPNQVSR